MFSRSSQVNAVSSVGVSSRFNLVRTLIKSLTDDSLLPLVCPVLLKWRHPHDISFSQRLEISGVAIVIPRLSPFAVLKGSVLVVSQFRYQQAGGFGQECLGTSVHQALSRAVSRTLFRRVPVVEDGQVDIRFRLFRSFDHSLRCLHCRLRHAIRLTVSWTAGYVFKVPSA